MLLWGCGEEEVVFEVGKRERSLFWKLDFSGEGQGVSTNVAVVMAEAKRAEKVKVDSEWSREKRRTNE